MLSRERCGGSIRKPPLSRFGGLNDETTTDDEERCNPSATNTASQLKEILEMHVRKLQRGETSNPAANDFTKFEQDLKPSSIELRYASIDDASQDLIKSGKEKPAMMFPIFHDRPASVRLPQQP
ncbi:hypothetical protein RvY_03063 [Ramazzottius varieornatus]|uniref:Uncharacterized protein n=1 Tax=Ramazzottius varieornatus TaxID=947166 RepID=A0A1D1UML9_RAMVA|nr:hypothetical protein RvY_03063 [Ramazzottius varieornatus]